MREPDPDPLETFESLESVWAQEGPERAIPMASWAAIIDLDHGWCVLRLPKLIVLHRVTQYDSGDQESRLWIMGLCPADCS